MSERQQPHPSQEAATQAALRAIAEAERLVAAEPPTVLSPEYLRLVAAVEALPENQDGADKSWIWPVYQFCRRHFRQFEGQ